MFARPFLTWVPRSRVRSASQSGAQAASSGRLAASNGGLREHLSERSRGSDHGAHGLSDEQSTLAALLDRPRYRQRRVPVDRRPARFIDGREPGRRRAHASSLAAAPRLRYAPSEGLPFYIARKEESTSHDTRRGPLDGEPHPPLRLPASFQRPLSGSRRQRPVPPRRRLSSTRVELSMNVKKIPSCMAKWDNGSSNIHRVSEKFWSRGCQKPIKTSL